MIKNRYWKRALQIAWPSVLESFFIALAGLIDTFMVSSIGPNAVAAIGLTTQPKFIALSFFIAISVSVSALVARRKGEQDKKMANQTMVTAMIVALLLCLIISSVFAIFTPQILKLSGSSPDTHDLGVSYFRIIMGGLIFNVISMTINAGQRGSGNTQIAFTTNLVSSLVNILFNYLLINGNLGFPKLGVAGAGLATVLGTFVAAIMSFSSLFRRTSYMSFKLIKKYALGFSNFIFKEILALGSNIFVENIAARIGFLVTAITAAKLGTDQFAAHNVGMNLLSLSFIKSLVFYQKWNMKWKKLKKSSNILKSKMKLNNRGDNMTFEEKLSEMYNEIANKISSMIPVEWEKVYTMAYIDDGGGEVFFNYTKINSDELNYYTDIPKEYNISVQVFDDLWMDLYDLFEELRNLFKEEGHEPWTSCEFDFTRDGKLNVSFDYIDWANSEFGPMGREHYYMYKKFGIWPEKEYAINWVEKIKDYVKEQEEAEL